MCEPKTSGGLGAVGVVSAVIVGIALFMHVQAKDAPPVKAVPAAPAPPPAAGFPWLAIIITAAVVLVLVTLAAVIVVRVLRRREPEPPPAARPQQARRALAQAQQRPALTARATTAREQMESR
jgi:flagellar basal body-associated protein FliL